MAELRTAIEIINFIVTEQEKGLYDFPQSSLNTLQEQVTRIQSMADNGEIPEDGLEAAKLAIAKGTHVLENSSPMELHEL